MAQSTAEAEYIALNSATREVAWIHKFLAEISKGVKAIPIRVDNEAAIVWATKETTPPQKRHVSVAYYYVNEQIAEGKINVEYVLSSENAADGLTKALERVKYQEFVEILRIKRIK